MNKKHFWKRGIAAACAVVTAATGLALPVFAADTSGLAVTPKVVALGDDCLAEVSGSESAVSYMADYLGGNQARAVENHLKYLKLMNHLFIEVNPIPVKAAMNLMGLNVGPMRMPLCAMSPANEAVLRETMKEVGLL